MSNPLLKLETDQLLAVAERLKERRRAAGGQEIRRLPRPLGREPLSFAQERLWFLDRLAPGGFAYNVPAAVRLSGRLAVPALAAALSEIVRRHETLRTRFEADPANGGRPFQIVDPPAPFALPLVDLGALPAGRRETEARRVLTVEADRPFDLARGPLLRASLLRLSPAAAAPAEHALQLSAHHIASDAWSRGILVKEVSRLYPAFAAGQPSPLAELPVGYADFARWQRDTLRGEALAKLVAYWRAKLGDPPPRLALPVDRPRPEVQRPDGGFAELALPVEVGERLRALARRHGATIFMVVVAALQALLSRLVGETDVAVGTSVAGRSRPELEGLIGFFVNTLVLRGDLAGDPPFRALLAQARDTALEAYAHQELPFEKLVEELNPQRSLAHTPFFQVTCALQNAPDHALEAPGLVFSPFDLPNTSTKFDLSFSVFEMDPGLGGSLTYRADLFDAATARRLLAYLETALAGIAADPETPLSRLPLLPAAERAQLLQEWSGWRRACARRGWVRSRGWGSASSSRRR